MLPTLAERLTQHAIDLLAHGTNAGQLAKDLSEAAAALAAHAETPQGETARVAGDPILVFGELLTAAFERDPQAVQCATDELMTASTVDLAAALAAHAATTPTLEPTVHALTLEFGRLLSEDEWREAILQARTVPHVRHLRADGLPRNLSHPNPAPASPAAHVEPKA